MISLIKKLDLEEAMRKNTVNIIIVIFMINYYFIHCFCFQEGFARNALEDNGWMSVFNIFVIMSVQAITVWHFCITRKLLNKIGFFSLFYVLQIYILREADFHRLFTAKNVDNIKFYTSDEIPLSVKFIAAIIFFPFFIFFAYLILMYGITMIKEFFKGTPWAVAFGFWGLFLVISQILDRSKFFNYSKNWRIKGIEEMFEVTAALLALSAIIYFTIDMYKRKKASEAAELID